MESSQVPRTTESSTQFIGQRGSTVVKLVAYEPAIGSIATLRPYENPAIQMKTAHDYYDEVSLLRRTFNASLDAFHDGSRNWEDHVAVADVGRARMEQIKHEMLDRADLAHHLADKTVMFQANPSCGEDGNDILGDELKFHFPLGFDDCEMLQGYFYISGLQVEAVAEYLSSRAQDVHVHDTDGPIIVL